MTLSENTGEGGGSQHHITGLWDRLTYHYKMGACDSFSWDDVSGDPPAIGQKTQRGTLEIVVAVGVLEHYPNQRSGRRWPVVPFHHRRESVVRGHFSTEASVHSELETTTSLVVFQSDRPVRDR